MQEITNSANNNAVETEQQQKPIDTASTGEVVQEQKDGKPESGGVTDPRYDNMELSYMNKDFIYECMSVPTHSRHEYRMVSFIILWARRNKIRYDFDEYGNIYLTKGELSEGEYYPCVTSHLDTVQDKQQPYIFAGVPLDIKTEVTKDGSHKISVDVPNEPSSTYQTQIGIGADDKGGVCICLSMFEHVEKLKACFFLEEEIGCVGSTHLDTEWFKDVGYVIGFDSPELFRAAWSCSGVKLFSYAFYEKYMKKVCDAWNYKDCFFSEPYTDVKVIREKTELMCMNFGNGGYNPHMATEYLIIEDMDYACGLGLALIDEIGCTQHKLKCTSTWENKSKSYIKLSNGTYVEADDETNDTDKLEMLGDRKRTYAYTTYNGTTSHSSPSTQTSKTENTVKEETVRYIVERYDNYISNLKEDTIESIKKMCAEKNVDSADFEAAISEIFSTDIRF